VLSSFHLPPTKPKQKHKPYYNGIPTCSNLTRFTVPREPMQMVRHSPQHPWIIHLNLANSNVSGTLDRIDFTSLANLTLLNLNANFLYGSIPPSISALISSDLSNNYLTGAVPYQLSNLQNVWHLNLGFNNLEVPDYSKFLPMPSLAFLSLTSNNLILEFPPFVLNCTALKYLDLSGSNFTGLIPEVLMTNLVNLKHLDCWT